MQGDLIYDVGAHHGHDTAFYLRSGFRVVAVEPDPRSVRVLREKFRQEVSRGTVMIVESAISKTRGTRDLYISKSDPGSCSIHEDEVDDPVGKIAVPCVPFSDILNEYGVPYYLKVDIQGADVLCLEALSRLDLPKYLSWEMDRNPIQCLKIVSVLGYRRYKLIDQKTFQEFGHKYNRWHKLTAKFMAHGGIAGTRKSNWEFVPRHSSGPFGEETQGRWRSVTEVTRQWESYQRRFSTRKEWSNWFDCHAAL